MELKLKTLNTPMRGDNTCPDCNCGLVYSYNDYGDVVAHECHCMSRRKSLRLIAQSGLKNMLDRYTFAAYETPQQWQYTAKDKAMRFARGETEEKWFMTLGSPGSGKTHLCTAICSKLLERCIEVRYMLWSEASYKAHQLANYPEKYDELIEPLKKAKALYIDDFFKTGVQNGERKITAADIKLAFRIIDARYRCDDLITIISSELTVQEIMDIDEAIGSRMYERSGDYCLNIGGENVNWRKRRK